MENTIKSTRLSGSEQDALRRDLCGDTDNLVSFADGTMGNKASKASKEVEGDIPVTKFAFTLERDDFGD